MVNYSEKYGIPQENFEKMYNTDQKMQFIEDYYGNQQIVSRINIVRFFRSTGNIEKLYNKDINEFNIIEITEWLKSLKLSKVSSFYNKKNVLKKYFEWSISKEIINISSINIFNEISPNSIIVADSLDSVISKNYFKNFDELNDVLNFFIQCYDYLEIEQFDVIKATSYLGYLGLEFEEACNLKKSDINFENNRITIKDKIFNMNDIISDFLSKFIKSDGYSVISGKDRNASRVFNYQDTDFVLRPTQEKSMSTGNYSVNNLRSKISTFTNTINQDDKYKNGKWFGHSLNYENVRDSGLYEKIYNFEIDNNTVFDSTKMNSFSKLVSQYYISTTNIHNLLEDYKKWKMCFYKK